MKHLTKIAVLITIMFGCLFSFYSSAFAAIPHLISYQGRLTEKDSGKPVKDGTYPMVFRFYDAEAQGQGNLLWQGSYQVTVAKGIFNLLLGSVSDSSYDFSKLAFDKPYYLEILFNNEIFGQRQLIAAAGYAIRAESLPSGVILICKESCPAGYKRISALDGKFLTGGAAYNPAAGGSNTHTHGYSGSTGQASGPQRHWGGDSNDIDQPGDAAKGTHTHSYSGTTSAADSRPEFATVVLCEKE